MKKTTKKALMVMLAVISCIESLTAATMPVSALPVKINDVTAVTIVFQTNVKYVDFGSSDIVGNNTTHGNILTVKSANPGFESTTMSVVTTDGKYYGFELSYSAEVETYVVSMGNDGSPLYQDGAYGEMELSDIKTSHVIFDEPVTDMITGCDSIIVGYAEDIDNIARCKAFSERMPNSSVTFITKSGKAYPFVVSYSATPARNNILVSDSKDDSKAMFSDNVVDEKLLRQYGKRVLERGAVINNCGTISQNMIFGMYGLFIKDNVLMFHFNLENDTQIDYEIDFVKLYIRDEKISKKTAVQEDELTPIYVYRPDYTVIKAKQSYSVVMFFKRFTIPVKRILYVEVFEKDGGRHLKFPISNKEILKAKRL